MLSESCLRRMRVYGRKWYTKNKKKVAARAKKYRADPQVRLHLNLLGQQRRAQRRVFINSFKSKPCTDCGRKYPPCVMDFDHVRGKKLFDLKDGVSRSQDVIVAEINKCELVCANCHRLRTESRR